MALEPRYRIKDTSLMFSSAQALTVTTQAYSTSELDFGTTGMAEGSPIDVVVYVSAIAATAASTFTIALYGGTATAPTTVLLSVPAVTGSAAFEKIITVPKDMPRFIRVGYLLTGTAASTATVTAFATARPVS
jgi:hypothetical protein